MEIFDVIIIGAGQAGLATSFYLKQHKIIHVVLEQDSIASSWEKQRWDSFKMNTPNWMNLLPGREIHSQKRHHFMTKDEFVDYLKTYVLQFDLPVLEKHKVVAVEKVSENFIVTIDEEGMQHNILTKTIVVASGIMNKILFPNLSDSIPEHILQVHAANYKNPMELPERNVLIIGGGQSGCQLAQELTLGNRKVYLAGSKVARAPRRYRGKDIMEWMDQLGTMDISTIELADNPNLDATQPQVSGVGLLGHTISYQSLHRMGVTILGGLKGVDHENLYFEDNCKEHIRYADETSDAIKKNVDQYLKKSPEIAVSNTDEDPSDVPDHAYRSASDLKIINFNDCGITTLLWATGFGYDFSYLNSSLLDKIGKPKHIEGKMMIEGLYCIGFPWLRKKKSGLVYGVNEDAKIIVENILHQLQNLG